MARVTLTAPERPNVRRWKTSEITDPNQISNKRIGLFLKSYEKTMDFSDACRLAGVPAKVMKRLFNSDPTISERMDDIMQARVDQLEALQMDAARENPEDRRWVLSRLRKEKWGTSANGKGMVVNAQINIHATPRELSDEELERIVAGGRSAVPARVVPSDE